jgi:hypothetical protein
MIAHLIAGTVTGIGPETLAIYAALFDKNIYGKCKFLFIKK